MKDEKIDPSSPFHDHDYFMVGNGQRYGRYGPTPAKQKKLSYIEADVPTQGYGFAEDTKDGILKQDDVYVVVEDEDESQLNVNVTGSGTTRTVVLHVPKDMKWIISTKSLFKQDF